jgi:hypothetical protein
MKQIKFNILNTKPGQKNLRKKPSKSAAWIAPALGATTVAVLLILFSTADPSHGQIITDTQVTLSCSDGHSVAAAVDSATLFQLTSALQAPATDPTAPTCTLDPAAAPTASWTVYDYNPSGHAIRPRVSPDSMPATTSGDNTSFQFLPNIYTALLTTTDSSLTGDLSSRMLHVTVSVSGGNGMFQDQNNGGCTPDTKTVRFYFASPKASGTTGPDTTGFYTRFWWSNPMSVPLVSDPQGSMTIGQPVNAVHMWSDWNGKFNDDSPEVMEAFQVAIHNVQTVGLSFGGGCFFENGVTTSDGSGTFNSTFTETP